MLESKDKSYIYKERERLILASCVECRAPKGFPPLKCVKKKLYSFLSLVTVDNALGYYLHGMIVTCK